MPLDALLRHPLDVLRSVPTIAVDAWNQPVYSADTVIASVMGRVEALSVTEQAQLADSGALSADFRAYTEPTTAPREGDRVQRTDTSETFQVRSVLPRVQGDGAIHHYELLLNKVTD